MQKVMDFTHNDTKSALEQRAQPLALRDIWYPLTLDQSLAKEKKTHSSALGRSEHQFRWLCQNNNRQWRLLGKGWSKLGFCVHEVGIPRWNCDSHTTIILGREEDNVGQFFQRHEKSIYYGNIEWANWNLSSSKWEIANTDGSLWFSLSHQP